MKNLLFLSSFSFLQLMALGQNVMGGIPASAIPAPSFHYEKEYLLDSSLNKKAWDKQEKGLHVSFVSTDQLYFRTEVPALQDENVNWEGTAWKGERVNIEILVWSPDTIDQVRLEMEDLKSSGGIIDKSKAKLNMVRYVVSNYPYGAKDATCGESTYKDVYLLPDRFESLEGINDRFDLPGGTVRPVWLTVDVPSSAAAGSYTTMVSVHSAGYSKKLQIRLRVQNQVLPSPHDWKHRLDLWQNPWVVAWVNNLKPWSEEHMLLLKKHLKMYADAGGSFITTYAVHSPWSDNSHWIEGGMITWIKKTDGSWKFDYSIFDKYVSLAMSLGIDKAITIYTPLPWGNRFRYRDEKTGNDIYEIWPTESKEYTANWHAFLTDLKKHLKQKGWLEKTYIGINENEMSQTRAAILMIKKHDPKWKITYAGDWHPELDSLLDDYCFVYGKESDVNLVRQRAARGKTTTFYVCCTPPYPNNFVFSPPIEGRWLGWYTMAHSYDGFLRWAYDAWPADPLRDARHPFWPAGDCFLVYPGGNSCIRFEKLREGFVDFEKIRIIKQMAAASKDKEVRALLQQLNDHLGVFLAEKDFDSNKIKADVDKGRKILESLSDRLAGSYKPM